MSRFHDDLVEARRRGETLSTPETAKAEPLAPTFVPVLHGTPFLSCSRCGAVVEAPRAPQHADWHKIVND